MKTERKVLVAVFLIDNREEAFDRQLYDDWATARDSVATWMRAGYVKLGLPGEIQDHFSPSQIYKVRFRPVNKVITSSIPSENPLRDTEEVAHFEDDEGKHIDIWTCHI